ncbi:TPA: hypothetical protein QB448_002260, partial [Pasteurella multocida]|nr:hypothetical protein [Pasteurella multocida]
IMIYLVKTDDKTNLAILEKLSINDFIDRYGEKTTTPYGVDNKYYFDPKTNKIYGWFSGRAIETSGIIYSENEANKTLAGKIIEEQDLLASENLAELLDQISIYYLNTRQEYYLEGEYNKDTIDYLTSLETIIEQIRTNLNEMP